MHEYNGECLVVPGMTWFFCAKFISFRIHAPKVSMSGKRIKRREENWPSWASCDDLWSAWREPISRAECWLNPKNWASKCSSAFLDPSVHFDPKNFSLSRLGRFGSTKFRFNMCLPHFQINSRRPKLEHGMLKCAAIFKSTRQECAGTFPLLGAQPKVFYHGNDLSKLETSLSSIKLRGEVAWKMK